MSQLHCVSDHLVGTGGVLLIGYEMYRLLSLSVPSLGGNKMAVKKRKTKTQQANSQNNSFVDLDENEREMEKLIGEGRRGGGGEGGRVERWGEGGRDGEKEGEGGREGGGREGGMEGGREGGRMSMWLGKEAVSMIREGGSVGE